MFKATPVTDVAVPKDEFKTDTYDTVDSTSSTSILTTPSPNNFNCHALKQEQDNDPDIQRIVAQLNNPDTTSHTSSSFIIKDDLLHKFITLSPSSVTTAVPYLPHFNDSITSNCHAR